MAERRDSERAVRARPAVIERGRVPRVCLCGRPNVGKSTLFNRLIGKKKALVLDEPGVTRDVYRAQVDWDGRKLELADLAGLEAWDREAASPRSRGRAASRARDRAGASRQNRSTPTAQAGELRRLSAEAAHAYLREADLVLFVVDGREELTPADEELARLVRANASETARDVIVVLSKIEGRAGPQAQAEAAALGWGAGLATSAEHNLGIGELREVILERLFDGAVPAAPEEPQELADEEERSSRGENPKRPIRLGVYGRPNVGKSTLVNRLLGARRMITSPIAGTTVDTIDTDFERENKFYRILDTAGIRRKSRTERGVEVLSVVQALKSVSEVDVAFFLIDGYEGITDQDEKLAGELIKAGRPVILVVNKWDLCRTKEEDYAERLRDTLGFLDFAPILFVSAERGMGLDSLWDLIDEILSQRSIVATTGELNRFVELVEGTNNPTGVRLFYASQTSRNPPTVTFMVSDPKKVHFAYERYLKNELRQRYGWMGSPLRLVFKARKRSPSKKRRDG